MLPAMGRKMDAKLRASGIELWRAVAVYSVPTCGAGRLVCCGPDSKRRFTFDLAGDHLLVIFFTSLETPSTPS